MASITTWVRLEPRARDPELLAGTVARLHDPLWLLARQWQLGELTGADAGSAITARTRVDIAPLDGVRTDAGAWRAFDAAGTPLDAVMAQGAHDAPARPPIDRRARTGRQLARMLASTPSAVTAMLTRFPLALTAAELGALDDTERRFAAVMIGRVPDGDAAAAALAPVLAAGDLPASFGIASAEVSAASTSARAWLAWRADLVRTSTPPSWQPERLTHRFEARARVGGGLETRLATSDHERTTVEWYDVDALEGDASQLAPTSVVATSIPTHVRFRGSPARRYWDLEDSAVNWAAMSAGPGDVARLITIELALAFADHWMLVPLGVAAGTLSHVRSLVVTDTFGVRTAVRSAAELDGPTSPWKFCELTHQPKVRGPLVFVPPASGAQLVGPTLEAIDLSRDDVDDVLWAIDRKLLGADGRPRDVPAPAPAEIPPLLAYRAGPDVPDSRHPYRARTGTAGLELVRAAIPGAPPLVARPDLPLRMSIAAAPATPAEIRTFFTLERTSDGAYHLVQRRQLSGTSPAPSFTLEFDRVRGQGGGES